MKNSIWHPDDVIIWWRHNLMTSQFWLFYKIFTVIYHSWKFERKSFSRSEVIILLVFYNLRELSMENIRWFRTMTHNFWTKNGRRPKICQNVVNIIIIKLTNFQPYCFCQKKVIKSQNWRGHFVPPSRNRVKDTSSNGTFVNKHLVGKRVSYPLVHLRKISMSLPENEVSRWRKTEHSSLSTESSSERNKPWFREDLCCSIH